MSSASRSLLELLQPAPSCTDDGVPSVGGCRLDDIAAAAGTPVLVVAEDALRARARSTSTLSPHAGRGAAWSSRPRRSRARRSSG